MLTGQAKAAWKAALSASHRGPKPGKQRVQKLPKVPNWNKKGGLR